MPVQSDEHERTLAFAEIALGQIRALRQPATPRHFEVWYAYATGHSPSLNKAVNDAVQRHGTLLDSDVNHIYQTYISSTRLTDGIDRVGSKVIDEIEQVMAMIGSAAGDASHYSADLAEASRKLRSETDNSAVRAIVERLIQATKEIQQNNQTLEARLSSSKEEISQLHEHLETIRMESLTDPLTLLANRKSFDDNMARTVSAARANNEHLSLLMTDIDHFKKFNDTFGHLTGDQVLRLVAMSVKQNVKGQDIAARYGGEEFAIVLPKTMLRDAVSVAESVRRAVMAKELKKRSTGEQLGRVTISIGVAELRPDDTIQTLIERADACLYAAKRGGRNRVSCDVSVDAAPSPAAVTAKVA